MLTFEGKQTWFALFWFIHFIAKQNQDQRNFFSPLVFYLSHKNSGQICDETQSFSYQGKSFSHIGDSVGHNFEPWFSIDVMHKRLKIIGCMCKICVISKKEAL